jgi:hypothetical protein
MPSSIPSNEKQFLKPIHETKVFILIWKLEDPGQSAGTGESKVPHDLIKNHETSFMVVQQTNLQNDEIIGFGKTPGTDVRPTHFTNLQFVTKELGEPLAAFARQVVQGQKCVITPFRFA